MKKKKIIFSIGLLLLIGIYLFLRLNKFEEKTTYHLDQGLHLLESWEMVTNRDIRLIGPMVSSKTFLDRGFFIGPQYYYVLATLGIVTNWDPMLINVILLFFELATLLLLVNWVKNKFGMIEALTVFGFFTFSRFFIIHSRFFWNPHFLLPLSILAVICLDNYLTNKKIKFLFIVGLLWGLAFGFHYASILWGLPILFFLLRNKIFWRKETFLALPFGFVIGDLPWFIFELRNNFYNTKTIWWVMTQAKNSGRMELHYFIYPLGIFILIGLIWCLNKISDHHKKIGVALGLVLMLSYFQMLMINDPIPLGHPIGWNYPVARNIVKRIIVNGCPNNFNIATTTSGDTRAYDLRFLLIKNDCKPMDVDKYPEAETLFLIAPIDRPPETETVWEVSSLGKFRVEYKEKINERVFFYELVKE